MELATFAIAVGTLELLFAGPALLNPDATKRWVLAILKEEKLIRVLGTFFLIICLVTLKQGMAVTPDLPGVMRAVVWIGAIKSLAFVWWPAHFAKLAESWYKIPGMKEMHGVLGLAAGAFFYWASCHLS